jgi:hypothetical protein
MKQWQIVQAGMRNTALSSGLGCASDRAKACIRTQVKKESTNLVMQEIIYQIFQKFLKSNS